MKYLKWTVIVFVIVCGILAAESEFFTASPDTVKYPILLQSTEGSNAGEANDVPMIGLTAAPENTQPQPVQNPTSFSADPGEENSITIGSPDPNSGYKFQLELFSKGAAIKRATLSEFEDRDKKNQRLDIITPAAQSNGTEVLAMANSKLALFNYQTQLNLDNLYWHLAGQESLPDGSQQVRFDLIIKETNANQPVIKIIKTYTIKKDNYLIDCGITFENLANTEEKVGFSLNGLSGIKKEDFRSDNRAIFACYKNEKNQFDVESANVAKLVKAHNSSEIKLPPSSSFMWAASINKYFAAILVPLPNDDKTYCDWIQKITGRYYDSDGDSKKESGNETIGVNFNISPHDFAAAGQNGSSRTYNFSLYLGPKEKSIFDKNEQYKNWGFVNVIAFNTCCCPGSIINPLAFGILAIMKWMYGFWPHNYGIVIIILVFIMRIIIHPLTKKSQVSMSKMSKLAPRAEEIKKKYANDKAEMNKQMMSLYREQGASPIMGMLPMFVQMPIWIALWSAVNTSVALRGAEFLPFWITDLSAPDALIPFPKVLIIPLLGWKIASFNFLPILMGVAFYFQQKLMPSQSGAVSNPQMEQQQKMMKIMMPLMFPLMLYNGPSGVNLYIMASTFAGVIEQHIIRKHIEERQAAEEKGLVSVTKKTGGKIKKKKPKPFFKT
ncbi:MAG: membrane protein insertase YidC [Sedimentisphaerales bacterium]|nr:membrane protein insertase YidC [Sedimentisphaerales bacterium]